MSAEIVTIASPELTAQINPFGAELWALRDADGRDLLWDGDPAFWSGRAPLLFPIICRLPEDRFVHDGRTFDLVKHGFARRRAFELVSQAPDRVSFRLAADAETRKAYPFDFVLEAEFALAGPELTMTVEALNRGQGPMPMAFGFHPAFRWPLPGSAAREAHVIEFAEPETGPLRRLGAEGLLDAAPRANPADGPRLALRDELFVEDAMIFERPASRALRFGAAGGRGLSIAWAGLAHLAVWTKPGAPYVCIEPWRSLPAEAQAPGPLAEMSDLAVLGPGERQAFSMSVRLD